MLCPVLFWIKISEGKIGTATPPLLAVMLTLPKSAIL